MSNIHPVSQELVDGPVVFVPLVRVRGSILDRMSSSLVALEKKWSGRRRPKAFYLKADDWATFTATEHPTIRTMFGNNPPIEVVDPAFNGVPVRLSSSKSQSRLYDNTTTGRSI